MSKRGCRPGHLRIETGRISINATGGSRANTFMAYARVPVVPYSSCGGRCFMHSRFPNGRSPMAHEDLQATYLQFSMPRFRRGRGTRRRTRECTAAQAGETSEQRGSTPSVPKYTRTTLFSKKKKKKERVLELPKIVNKSIRSVSGPMISK